MENGFTKGKARMRFAQIAASPKKDVQTELFKTDLDIKFCFFRSFFFNLFDIYVCT